MQRRCDRSGTPWEAAVGYSRSVRVGKQIFVSGTTASQADGSTVAPGDPYQQTVFILQKIEHTLQRLGARLTDVVRTRMFVTDINRWEEYGRAHGEFFRGIDPAATMVEVQRLINSDHMIEIEVDALLPDLDR
jgi:enamine deaminase RidA (YjgF/YER057c/UK114 family)